MSVLDQLLQDVSDIRTDCRDDDSVAMVDLIGDIQSVVEEAYMLGYKGA